MFKRFIAVLVLLPSLACAVTWTGSHDLRQYPSASACLAAQKDSWDKSWRDSVSCRTWSDQGLSQNADGQDISSRLGGCAGGSVWCTAPPPDNDACSEKVGQTEIVNVTSGWKRTPKPDYGSEEWVYTYRFPSSGSATVCGGSAVCEMTIDANEPCSECGAYVSQVPAANGLHRVSTDFRGHFTGKTCSSASTSDLPPEALHKDDTKDPPCPGYVGEVNGVRGCFGTASNPIRPVAPPDKPTGHGPADSGNPAAGTKPSAGEGSGSGGSGRTPSTGAGGSSGGPAGAAAGSGTKPDGTAPKPGEGKEQANCGAPGQPKCGIDESGTPTKFEGKGDLLSGWEEGVKTNRATIEKSGTGIFESFNIFFSAPPLVGCEPIELPDEQFITRHCDVVDGTRSVMGYIWALTALWLCVGWIREAI